MLHNPVKTHARHMCSIRTLQLIFSLLLVQCLFATTVHAASELPRLLEGISAQEFFLEADKLGEPEGDPVVVAAFKQDQQLGIM